MKLNFKVLYLCLAMLMVFSISTTAYAYEDISNVSSSFKDDVTEYMDEENFDEIMNQVVEYMNENANIISTTGINNSYKKTYEIELDNGEIIKSIISIEEVDINQDDGLYNLNASGSKDEPASPGKSYTLTWTIDREGFLGGSFTHTMKYNTSKDLVDGYLYLNGTSTSISVTPPQFYTVKDKDSYFSKQNGRKIGTRSYVTLQLDSTAGIIFYNSSFQVDLTGYSDYITVDYSHSWL